MDAVIYRLRDIAGASEDGEPLGPDYHFIVLYPRDFQSVRQSLLRAPVAVNFSSVEPVDAAVQGSFDDGVYLFLMEVRHYAPEKTAAARELHHP